MKLPVLQLKKVKTTSPSGRALAAALEAVDKDRDGAVGFQELAKLNPKLRSAAAKHFDASEPLVAPIDTRSVSVRSPHDPYAAECFSDAELKKPETWRDLRLAVDSSKVWTYELRIAARIIELGGPSRGEARQFALEYLKLISPERLDLDTNPEAFGVLKRLAKAVGVRTSDVLVETGRNEALPLPGYERMAHYREGVPIVELLQNPKTKALGMKLMNAELDGRRTNKNGFVSKFELQSLPEKLQAELAAVVKRAQPKPRGAIVAEKPTPISQRATVRGEYLVPSEDRLLKQVEDVPDAMLMEWSAITALHGATPNVRASPFGLRAMSRALELSKESLAARDWDPLKASAFESQLRMLRRRLADTLTSGILTPAGLANLPGRTSLEVVLRAAKAAGIKPAQVRVTIGGGDRVTLDQLQKMLGDLDLLPVVRGPAHEPPRVGGWAPAPRKPAFTRDAPSYGPAIGGAPRAVLRDSFWDGMQRVMNLPDWSYYGSPSPVSVDAFPPVTVPAPLAPSPVVTSSSPVRAATGYVNPWTMLADPRASSYFKAVSQSGYRSGWLEFISR